MANPIDHPSFRQAKAQWSGNWDALRVAVPLVPGGWPEPETSAARREAARALALLWLGRKVAGVSIVLGKRFLDGTRVPIPPAIVTAPDGTGRLSAGLTPVEAEAVVHLAGYEGAVRAGWPAARPLGPDPDFRLALSLLPATSARPLKDLQALVQRHLAASISEFYALVFALQDRRRLTGAEVRRLVLRARFQRPFRGRRR